MKCSIGIDMASDKFDVRYGFYASEQEAQIGNLESFPNNPKGFKLFLKWVSKHALEGMELRFIVEATGVYHQKLVATLFAKGYRVCVVLPNKVKHFKKSYNLSSKTDGIDAYALCLLGLERKLRAWKPADPCMKQLKELSRERAHKVKDRTRAKNRLHALSHQAEPSKLSLKRLKEEIKLFSSHIKSIDQEIELIIEQNDSLSQDLERICKVKGLTPNTVACILGELGGFQFITANKQLASFCGLEVQEFQSGKSSGKPRISKKGNKYVRSLLYMPALSAARYDPHLSNFYNRLVDKGLKKKQAAIAVMRKLLLLIYTLYKSGEQYDPYRNVG